MWLLNSRYLGPWKLRANSGGHCPSVINEAVHEIGNSKKTGVAPGSWSFLSVTFLSSNFVLLEQNFSSTSRARWACSPESPGSGPAGLGYGLWGGHPSTQTGFLLRTEQSPTCTNPVCLTKDGLSSHFPPWESCSCPRTVWGWAPSGEPCLSRFLTKALGDPELSSAHEGFPPNWQR